MEYKYTTDQKVAPPATAEKPVWPPVDKPNLPVEPPVKKPEPEPVEKLKPVVAEPKYMVLKNSDWFDVTETDSKFAIASFKDEKDAEKWASAKR